MHQNLTKPHCGYPGCERPRHSGELCSPHYQQSRRYGEPRPIVDWKQLPCRGPECPNNATGRSGYCASHRSQMAHTGRGARKLRHIGVTTCAAKNCELFTGGRGLYCYAHRTLNTKLKREYGITLDDRIELAEQQGHACKICGDMPGVPYADELHVDHCHTTGRVRGLLCGPCNRALGLFRDDPVRLLAAARYVQG